ncbi:hypothetical protein [Spiroplasma endosymbiont of Othius punctulatus]|uniref:hypothetical protein n=1 Tax=Spiroplasma endosymbiont of Othius punctulatus TaxID=3066289 RepID=UPI0030D05C5D
MIYWKIKCNSASGVKYFDNYYETTNIEEQQWIHNVYKSRNSSSPSITCASIVKGIECGCDVVVKDWTKHRNQFELSRLPSDSHKFGCASERKLFEPKDLIDAISIEQLVKMLSEPEIKYITGEVVKNEFIPTIELSGNEIPIKNVKEKRNYKVVDVQKTLDYIFLRKEFEDEKFTKSEFEKDKWQNCFYSWKKDWSISPTNTRMFKWNWATIPDLKPWHGNNNCVNIPIHKMYFDINGHKKTFEANEMPFFLKIIIPPTITKEMWDIAKKIPLTTSGDKLTLSILTTSRIEHNIQNLEVLNSFNFNDVKLMPIVLQSESLLVVNGKNWYKHVNKLK